MSSAIPTRLNNRSLRYDISLADRKDDHALRVILAENPMGEDLQVSFRREPNYFDACSVQGDDWQIIKCTDTTTGQIVALASRFILNTWINGEIKQTGYLADLRITQSARKRDILARGYQFLKSLHQQQNIKFYYSLILSNNEPALKLLTSKRAGLPNYIHIGKVHSPAIFLDFPRSAIRLPGIEIKQADHQSLTSVLSFIKEQSTSKQYAPVFEVQHFDTGRLQGLKPADIYYASKDDEVIASLAIWNQGNFRQTHIERYSTTLNIVKPFVNALAYFSPLKPLPKLGDKIPYVYFAMMHAKDNNTTVFSALLRHVYRQIRKQPWHYAIAGMHEHNPLLPCLLSYRHINSSGELFTVTYEDANEANKNVKGSVPHIEMAMI